MNEPDLFKDKPSTPATPINKLPPQGVLMTPDNLPQILADAKGGGEDFEPCPSGTHLATCIHVVDVGTQISEWMGKKKTKRRVRLTFELADEMMQDGRPFVLGKRFTLSLHKKAALRQALEAWRNRPFTEQELAGFNLTNLLGAPCIITVTHEAKPDDPGKVYANIQSIGTIIKGMKKPVPVNPLVVFSISQGRNETFNGLKEWMKDECSKCLEWSQVPPAMEAGPVAEPEDDDGRGDPEVPF